MEVFYVIYYQLNRAGGIDLILFEQNKVNDIVYIEDYFITAT